MWYIECIDYYGPELQTIFYCYEIHFIQIKMQYYYRNNVIEYTIIFNCMGYLSQWNHMFILYCCDVYYMYYDVYIVYDYGVYSMMIYYFKCLIWRWKCVNNNFAFRLDICTDDKLM